MQLFYAPDFITDSYTLCEEESAHCVKVLRASVGDTLHFTDGRGTLIAACVEVADKKRTVVRAVERLTILLWPVPLLRISTASNGSWKRP